MTLPQYVSPFDLNGTKTYDAVNAAREWAPLLPLHLRATWIILATYYPNIFVSVDTLAELNRVLLPLLVQLVPILTGVVRWFGTLPGGVKKFLIVLMGAAVVGGPILMFTGAIARMGGAVIGAISWIGRLGTASEVAAGAQGMGGLAAFSAGLARAIPIIGLFVLALSLRKRVIPSVKRTVNDALHPSQGVQSHFTTPATGGTIGLGGVPMPSTGGLDILGLHIPGLATGGLVSRAGLSLVGEAGPELLSLPRGAVVSPNVGPSNFNSSIQDTLFPGFGKSKGGGDDPIIVQVVLDGKVVAQSVNNTNRKAQNRR